MALHTRVRLTKLDSLKVQDLDHHTLLHIYRTMYLSRRLDDREIQLKRQNTRFSSRFPVRDTKRSAQQSG